MITNRSSHMPTLTISEMTNNSGTLRRTARNQSNWIVRMLQTISAQYDQA